MTFLPLFILKNQKMVNIREGQVPAIGKMKDFNTPGNVLDGQFKVADYLPDMGNPQANWHQNSRILRSVMNEGVPIKDVSMFSMDNAGFLGAERNLLQSRGWTYFGDYWYPPQYLTLVSYRGKNNRVEITFSSIGYEITCQFIDNSDNYFSLQDGLEYENMPEYKGLYQISSKTQMEEGILYLAQVVKKLLERINISDSQNFQKVYQFRIVLTMNLLK